MRFVSVFSRLLQLSPPRGPAGGEDSPGRARRPGLHPYPMNLSKMLLRATSRVRFSQSARWQRAPVDLRVGRDSPDARGAGSVREGDDTGDPAEG